MPEQLWTCIATCQVCGREVNRAEHVPESEKSLVAVSAPLMGICPVRGHNTLSDCNIGVNLQWLPESETAAAGGQIICGTTPADVARAEQILSEAMGGDDA